MAPGAPLIEPERWQPINLVGRGHAERHHLAGRAIQTYIGAHWGNVTPFAMRAGVERRALARPGARRRAPVRP